MIFFSIAVIGGLIVLMVFVPVSAIFVIPIILLSVWEGWSEEREIQHEVKELINETQKVAARNREAFERFAKDTYGLSGKAVVDALLHGEEPEPRQPPP